VDVTQTRHIGQACMAFAASGVSALIRWTGASILKLMGPVTRPVEQPEAC
jgi:hypothetical protein